MNREGEYDTKEELHPKLYRQLRCHNSDEEACGCYEWDQALKAGKRALISVVLHICVVRACLDPGM